MSSTESASASDLTGPASVRGAERLRWWRWVVVGGYMLAIFVASAQSSLPELPGKPSDKTEHVVAYAVLSLLIVWALTRGAWRTVTVRTVVTAASICAAYGWSDELHQRFVPSRQYDLMDLAADTIGAVAAAGGAWVWGIISRGRSRAHGP